MGTYKIEGGVSFYDELYKSLDECDNDEINVCQITGLPLNDTFVTLECKHKFNYDALYKEICRQKYDFKTYVVHTLSKHDQIKLGNSGLNYFIKCPYCRNLQFTILPYYEELGLEKKYGINSLDNTLPNAQYMGCVYTKYGVTFKNGICCYKNPDLSEGCNAIHIAFIPNTNLSYCTYHYFNELHSYTLTNKKKLLDEKKKLLDEKKRLSDEKKEFKQQILNNRKKLFDEKNIEREAKGLLPLKRLPIIKKNIENIVEQQNSQIQEYIPEETNKCKTILKTGVNKGTLCGRKTNGTNGLCKRHSNSID